MLRYYYQALSWYHNSFSLLLPVLATGGGGVSRLLADLLAADLYIHVANSRGEDGVLLAGFRQSHVFALLITMVF